MNARWINSGRGSLESVGVVADVGLFLSLLVERIKKMNGTPHLQS